MYKFFDGSGFMIVYNSSLGMYVWTLTLVDIHNDTEAMSPAEFQKSARAAGLLMLTVLLSYTLYSILLFYGS
jgi:hypothetical protein